MTYSPVSQAQIDAVSALIENARNSATEASIGIASVEKDKAKECDCATANSAAVTFAKLALFDRKSQAEAISILSNALAAGYQLSDTAFWLIVAYMEAGRYADARQTLSSLVRTEPTNESAAALLEVFKARVQQEGKTGLMYAGVAVAAIVGAYLIVRWWRGTTRIPPSSFDYYSARLDRHREASSLMERRVPTGSSGSSASAPSSFGNRGSGSWRV